MISTFRKWLIGPSAILLTACGGAEQDRTEAADRSSDAANTLFRYNREYVFIGSGGTDPTIVPFTFRSSERGDELDRGVQAWLARGGTWERFLDETATTSAAGGVWRVTPQPDLQVTVGGPAELEALRFERGERRLRLELERPITGWQQGGESRFRLLSGQLAVGSETLTGPVLEMLRVERTLADGWPPAQDFDAIFLTSGDSIQLVLAETIGGAEADERYAWTRTSAGERMWPEAEVRWLEFRAYEEARRDIPRRWSFHIPAAGIQGELEASGFDAVLGPERAGRRAVEIRYTVQGWIDMPGGRRDAAGLIRHTQQ
ncbi:MAG: hypothetical protein WD766_08110 [Gemmatimonadota bacterium]